jgi:hypothetical protein
MINGNKKERCPYRFKWQLVNWAIEYKGFTYSKAQKLPKKTLYRIWFDYNGFSKRKPINGNLKVRL